MADEPEKKEPEPKPTESKAPVMDPKVIQEAVNAALTARDEREAQQKAAQAAAAQRAAKGEDPVRKVILESVGDELGQMAFNSNNAVDLAKFYALNPEAKEFAIEIEKKFVDLAANGNAQDRETIWHWYRGANLDKFVARAKEREVAEQEAAVNGLVAGPGGTGLPRGTRIMRDPYEMSSDELEKALEGKEF